MKRKSIYSLVVIFLSFFVAVFLFDGCKKEEESPVPTNPFESIVRETTAPPVPPDPNTLLGIHANIFQPRCAVPGCHDGNFEPDFRTPQSAFTTLVYHPIVKNNAAKTFTFRVVPFQSAESVLYERLTNCCFVNQDDRMPQDNIGVPLSDADIKAIKTWIDNGAKDLGGNVPSYPNLEPTISPFYNVVNATDTKISYIDKTNRIDSISYNPFLLKDTLEVIFAFIVEDDSTDYAQLKVNQLRLSLDPNDFSNSINYTATPLQLPPPDNLTIFVTGNVNTAALPKNKIVYMRYFVNDDDHLKDTHFPTDNLPLPYKTLWSFYVY